MLLKHWKLILAAIVLGGAVWGGWIVNGWRKDSQQLDAFIEQNEALTEQINTDRREFKDELARERDIAAEAARARAEAEARHAALQEDIANARLSVPESRTPAEVDSQGVHSCAAPLGSIDFIRLWNNAARDGAGTNP